MKTDKLLKIIIILLGIVILQNMNMFWKMDPDTTYVIIEDTSRTLPVHIE